MTPFARRCIAVAALLLATRTPAGAQERELHWRALDVQAHLDSAGRLHVKERQDILFTGDWNGGERTFNLRSGQDLDFHRMVRVDSTGREVEMRAGELTAIDEYQFTSSEVLRWRSRLPSDPPFDATPRSYVLEYTLGNILVSRDSGLVLDHDFAFPDRAGIIERFTLHLSFDPAWRVPPSVPLDYAEDNLETGRGYVLTFPLTFTGSGRPSAVHYGLGRPVRLALAGLLLAAFLVLVVRLFLREAALGRFAAPLPPGEVDEAFLSRHVFTLAPEAAGALWDNTTAAPEVSAVLARLVQEKKVSAEVKVTKVWIFSSSVLHLKLLVPRDEFRRHERQLVDALFQWDETETSTSEVRKRYRTSGFDPGRLIAPTLHTMVGDPDKADPDAPPPSRTLTLVLIGVAIGCFLLGMWQEPGRAVPAVFVVMPSIFLGILAGSQAYLWRGRLANLGAHSLRFLIPLGILLGGISWFIVRDALQMPLGALAAIATTGLLVANLTLNRARSVQGAERIARRKRLYAAREYLKRELMQREPRLKDEWFPWLIGFGLGPHMDHWFKAFGGAGTGMHAGNSFGSSGSGASFSSASRGSSWTGMGGGGGFSGGGSSASFAAAAGAMGASISKPSSSSSGGGGGGGGSSGGGGGGGW